MTPTDAEGQAEMLVAMPRGRGRNPRCIGCGAVSAWTAKEHSEQERQDLMSAVVERENMLRALQRVQSNKGVPGVDGLRVEDLRGHLVLHWPASKEQLLNGTYMPQPVLGVEIPKHGGGMRQLGISTVTDRLIQQALHQILVHLFDPEFSEFSYGFRPGRSAHQAVLKAREYVSEGRRFVVDMGKRSQGLEKVYENSYGAVWTVRVAPSFLFLLML